MAQTGPRTTLSSLNSARVIHHFPRGVKGKTNGPFAGAICFLQGPSCLSDLLRPKQPGVDGC
jgi:hypothetical protein